MFMVKNLKAETRKNYLNVTIVNILIYIRLEVEEPRFVNMFNVRCLLDTYRW